MDERLLIYCWVAEGFHVLVPKLRGTGFLKVPYGHHVNERLNAISDAVSCDICGLDGALEFQCRSVYYGDAAARSVFEAKVLPALCAYYGIAAKEVDSSVYWELNPVMPQH